MTDETNPANSSNAGYERQDIGVSGVLYFLLGLAVAGLLVFFIVDGLYHFLDKRSEADQTPVNPLVTNAPADTRHIPAQYEGNYEKYLKENFPAPQLEVDERGQLNGIRLTEEETLSTYDWIDKNAGTVRIPIDRAMDLIAQRGLPTRQQAASAAAPASAMPQPEKKKGPKKRAVRIKIR
jgi:hypothetical protein